LLELNSIKSAKFRDDKKTKYIMKNLKFTNLAVFIIFFGIALIEAFQKQNWLEAFLFLALGIISLWADIQKN